MLGKRRPDRELAVGTVAMVLAIAGVTAAVGALSELAPITSLGVLYLPVVLLIASRWGVMLGLVSAVLSTLTFNFFHLPPVGRLTISDPSNWVALGVFLVAALICGRLAGAVRARAVEAEMGRREAQVLAKAGGATAEARNMDEARALVGARLCEMFGLASASIRSRATGGDRRTLEIPLRKGGDVLLVPADIDHDTLEAIRRLAPSLGDLLTTRQEHDRLADELLESEAVRRSDVAKTAILRAISHDLRSPMTALAAAASGLQAAGPAEAEELRSVITEETTRLTRLVDDLLDMSRIESGSATPAVDWCSIEEVIGSALRSIGAAGDQVEVTLEPALPLVKADPVQLERAVGNLLVNALEHGGGRTALKARRVRHAVRIRVEDDGPGIPAALRERVFEPFERGALGHGDRTGSPGAGLGLAIARGFVEANNGRVFAEGMPSGGTAMVIELPLQPVPAELRTGPRATG